MDSMCVNDEVESDQGGDVIEKSIQEQVNKGI